MILRDKIQKENLIEPFVKAVADVKKEAVSFDCELHSDCAEELILAGSEADDLWGFDIYPDYHLDFVSLINIRPSQGNRKIEIESEEVRGKISEIMEKFLN